MISLERSKSLPIQLRLEPLFPTAALGNVLVQGKEISSLTITRQPHRIPLLRQLLMLSRPSLKQLHIYTEKLRGRGVEEQPVQDVWQDFPFLRELFVCRYSIPIDQFTAPNLVHLALEYTGIDRIVTVQGILDMLRGSPLLETLLIVDSGVPQDQTQDHSPVSLPKLRSIELGFCEVRCGLILYLQFPPDVAAGFREMTVTDVRDDVSLVVVAAMQHVLRRIDIHRVTLAVPPHHKGSMRFLVRFDGLRGSLEISTDIVLANTELQNVLFGPRGVLFSNSPRIKNVRELHLVGCSFEYSQGFHHIDAAMPNLISISLFHCEGANLLGLPAQADPPSPPFPRLERVMILGSGVGLKWMARARRDHGVPLKTLVVGRGHTGFECNHLEDYVELEEFVGDLRIGCPTEVLKWGTENEIFNIWSKIEVPGPVSANRNPDGSELNPFCSTFSIRYAGSLSFVDLTYQSEAGGCNMYG